MENIEFDQQNMVDACSSSFEDYEHSDYFFSLIDEQLDSTSQILKTQSNLSGFIDFNNNYNNEGFLLTSPTEDLQFEAYSEHTKQTKRQQNQIKRKRILNEIQRAEATKRERRRMLKLNEAFEKLRQILPISELAKSKLSRVETLKYAVQYMKSMIDYLNESDSSF